MREYILGFLGLNCVTRLARQFEIFVTVSNNSMVVFFQRGNWVTPFEVMTHQPFGIRLKVSIEGADSPESEILSIWSFGEAAIWIC